MQIKDQFDQVWLGAALTLAGLTVGVALGIAFGMFEGSFKSYIANGIAQYPNVHDAASKDKIWRYAQRAHFHATGVAGFSIGLILLTMYSSLRPRLKSVTAVLIGIGSLYPMAWLNMFVMAPSIGREPAHSHFVTEVLTYVGVGGLLVGMLLLFANLFLGLMAEPIDASRKNTTVQLLVDVAVHAKNVGDNESTVRTQPNAPSRLRDRLIHPVATEQM